jgi:enoyl-CoA hydratase/carnithine racemase
MSAIENRVFAKVVSLPDASEGIAAFMEKRAPVWSGKISADTPD